MIELVKKKKLERVLQQEVVETAAESDDGNIVYNQVCRASAKVLHLQAAHMPSSGWKYIVNVDKFVQAITVDRCRLAHTSNHSFILVAQLT